MSSRLLLTGFEPFGDVTVNPSWEAVRVLDGERWGGTDVRAARLPVSYERAPGVLREEVERLKPGALVMFGVAQERKAVSLERFAANRMNGRTADNEGVVRSGPIDAAGPERRESALPLDRIAARLRRDAVPVEFSDDAGGYLCNRVFWEARAAWPGLTAGFVHVPSLAALDLPGQRRAVKAVAEEVAFESVSVEAATTSPVAGDVAANVGEMERRVREARERGAKLVLFPELATSGIAARVAVKCAEREDGSTAERLGRLARETGTWIAYGFPESRGRALFNSAALLGPTGERHVYRKRRLFGSDFDWATPGDRPGNFETSLGRVRFVICHDCVYSDIAAEGDGSELVLMPTNWIGDSGPAEYLSAFRAPVLVADRVGEEDGIRFEGRSGLTTGGTAWRRPLL